MRRFILVMAVALLLAATMSAQPYSGCCNDPALNKSYPAGSLTIFGGLDANGCIAASKATWSADPCPVITPPESTGWWDLVKSYADKFVIWKGDAASIARILALLASFLALVQGLKKLLENAAKWAWLVKLIPGVGSVLAFFAHGWGPMVLNALITGGTLCVAAFQDGTFTAGEALAIVGAVVGVDVLYKLIRGWLFPKTA